MAVSGGIDFDNKRWEEEVHTQLVHTNEAAPVLPLMCPETVKRIAENRDVQVLSLMRIWLPLREMMAKPVPRIWANELFPMQTQWPVTGW
jgi:hypothetical protein